MGTALTTRTPPVVRWAPSVLRGPADADHYRVKVGRYGDRWYTDPLPADSIADASDWQAPSWSIVKGAAGKDWSFVANKRNGHAEQAELLRIANLEPDSRTAAFNQINKDGLWQAAGRGTIVHLWAEDFLAGLPPRTITEADLRAMRLPKAALAEALTYLSALSAFFDAYQPEVIAAEYVALHRTLNGVGYGCTPDVACRIQGDDVGVDWKSRGVDSDHGAYPEEAAQIAAGARAEYMIVDDGNGTPIRALLPPLTSGIVVSIKPDGCRVYPVDLDKAFRHTEAMHAFWVARKAEREPIGRAWPPRKASTIDVASPGDATGTETPPLAQSEAASLDSVTSVAVPDIAAVSDAEHLPPSQLASEPTTAAAPPAAAVVDDFPTYAPKGAACDTTSAGTATNESSGSPRNDAAPTSAAEANTSPSSPTTTCSDSPSKSRRTTSRNSDSTSTPTETLTDLTEPVSDADKAAADAEYRARMIRADSNPADKAAADQLVATVKQSEWRDLISQWVTEGNRAGVPWSVRAARTVVNYERLRTALELIETLRDEKLVRLVLDEVSERLDIPVGERFGRMTVEECINALACVHRIGFDLHVRYAADGEPSLVAR
jgi:hypothetical protein